ncbi:MFS transporter [Actinomadura viridis]|uniref:MFS family permease n=1 Tax=Actinomadura viridis TaxID=58110 RepID=A0A931DMF1_9ACTN|nr:MFS transporter [Actinomadura viridis]MBG6092650.1 MFS family permease [Actinomadura viridis]
MSNLIWERDFKLLWAGSAASQLGAVGAGTATPLLALALDGSSVSAGWATAAGALPGLFFHLPAGWLADRADRRLIMHVSQVVRVLSAALLVLGLWLLDGPSWLLIAAVVMTGTSTVFYGIAEIAAVRDIVYGVERRNAAGNEVERGGRRESAMARHEARIHMAQVAGRPLGGFLFGLWQLLPYVVDALTSLFSLYLMSRMSAAGEGRGGAFTAIRHAGRRITGGVEKRKVTGQASSGGRSSGWKAFRQKKSGRRKEAGRKPAGAPRPGGGIKASRVLLANDSFLCTVLVVCAIANFFFQAIVLLLIVSAQERGISSSLIGLFLSATGIGGLAGALAAPRALRRRTPRRIVVRCVWIWLALVSVVAVAGHPIVGLIAWGSCSYMGAHVNVALEVHKAATVPRELQGKITGITRFVTGGAVPLGALSGGYLVAELTPETTAYLVTGVMAVMAVAVTALVGSGRRRGEREPEPERARREAPPEPEVLGVRDVRSAPEADLDASPLVPADKPLDVSPAGAAPGR